MRGEGPGASVGSVARAVFPSSPRTAATVPHAALRWARAVVGMLDCAFDPNTTEAWGAVVGASGGAIRQWCRSAGVRPKASLDFARVLRAVALSRGGAWELFNLLDVVDARTMSSLFQRGGVAHLLAATEAPQTMRYLTEQRFVSGPALQALAALLAESQADSAGEARSPGPLKDGPLSSH